MPHAEIGPATPQRKVHHTQGEVEVDLGVLGRGQLAVKSIDELDLAVVLCMDGGLTPVHFWCSFGAGNGGLRVDQGHGYDA